MLRTSKAPVYLAATLASAAFALYSSPAEAGAKISVNDDTWLAIGILAQPQFVFTEGGLDDGEGWSIDPRMRRIRILFYGQYTDKVAFFVETDNPKYGFQSDWSQGMFIQDAWMEYNVSEALQIDVGMLLAPFSHHGMQGAVSLMSLDYRTGVIRYPAGSHKVWRDMGVMFRGELADRKIEYRLAVMNGVQNQLATIETTDGEGNAVEEPHPAGALNPSDMPRFTGRLNVSLFDSEAGPGVGGFFYDGIYLKEEGGQLVSAKKVVSVGASFDYQPLVIYTDDSRNDYLAAAGDVFVDLPVADGTQSVNGQVDAYYYNYGEGNPLTGVALFAEAGYRINRIQPLVALETFDSKDTTDADIMAIHGGLNWWYMGHKANVKGQVGASKAGDGDFGLSAVVQSQLYF